MIMGFPPKANPGLFHSHMGASRQSELQSQAPGGGAWAIRRSRSVTEGFEGITYPGPSFVLGQGDWARKYVKAGSLSKLPLVALPCSLAPVFCAITHRPPQLAPVEIPLTPNLH